MADTNHVRIPIAPLTFWTERPSPPELGAGGRTGLADGHVIEPGYTYYDKEAAKWLTASVFVPTEWAGERVGLHIEITGGEPLLFVDGEPYQALDYNHAEVLLYDPARGGEAHQLLIEIYAPTAGREITLQSAFLVRIDRAVRTAILDDAAAQQIAAVPEKVQDSGAGTMTCIGHSHLDLAYLWALPNTRKKVGRTWASTLRLLDEYPDFCFTQSQPYLYDVCKTDYPDLWERVKTRVAEGRWETTGAMWVEPDTNIPSGESLIRQVLHGQALYKREFGEVSRVAWLPDTFGFPASFPQILAGCGIHYLLTSKISWNDTNRFPHDTFRWRGSDGFSEILTHFVTAPQYHAQLKRNVATYNGDATVAMIVGAWDAYRQQNVNAEILHCVGYGDGGGGATPRMVEMVRRFADAPGVPHCAFGRADDFFDRLDAKRDAFPAWRGELYLENHRGTLTSQAWLKRANRQCETLLRNAEIFSVLAETETGAAYPAEELGAAWRTLLTNQFHDILAGTIIPEAVADARRDFAQIEEAGTRLLHTAMTAIAERIPVKEDTFVVFNPTDTLRPSEAVRVTVPANVIKAVEFADASDALLLSQFLSVDKKGNRDYLVLVTDVGALGYQTITAFKSSGPQEESTVFAERLEGAGVLENDFAYVTLNENGQVVSFRHKISEDSDDEPDAVREREVIADGEHGNVLAVYEDKPAAYDAWNIDRAAFHTRTDLAHIATVERFAVIAEGPVRAGIEVVQRFRESTVTQRIYLYAQSPRLEIETVVDWHEHQTLLCVHFPVAVNAERAVYEIQHGYIERPTYENTSWDAARFEVSHHRWMDLSEGDYGVSLLNDCKYGGCVRENDLRLTLIKSGIYPDPDADLGLHQFTYALLPHTGDFRNETVDEAHGLNYPLLTQFVRKSDKRKMPALPRAHALASVNDQGLVIDAIKRAEDGNGYIVRLYDAFNTRGAATLTFGFDIAEAFATNLLEENGVPLLITGEGDIAFSYHPHEIKTFRVVPSLPKGQRGIKL
ncbi:MAG: alpha-mannosidase [Akkermansiaceae bacterium]|nr:alpha-mannosidase [Armatimonadota bacterium]